MASVASGTGAVIGKNLIDIGLNWAPIVGMITVYLSLIIALLTIVVKSKDLYDHFKSKIDKK